MEENMDKELEKQSQEVIKKPEKKGLIGRVIRWGAALGLAGTTATAAIPSSEVNAESQSPAPIVQPESQKTAGFGLVPNSGISEQTSQEITNKIFPEQQVEASSIESDAFNKVWEEFDGPVARGEIVRSWTYGPAPFDTRTEPYVEAPSGVRTVQYYDKTRMEVTDPNADRNNRWFVTSGLLVKEMIEGWMQIGNSAFESNISGPSTESVAGDPGSGPTYKTFKEVLNIPNPLQKDQVVTQTISKEGIVRNNPALADKGVSIAFVAPETGHGYANKIWDFLVATYGEENAVKVAGLPIADPYWVRATVNGVEKDILVQLCERGAYTFTFDNPEGWQVETANVGQHYFNWRYHGGEIPGAQEEKIEGNDWSVINVKGAAVSIKLKDGDNSKRIINEQVTSLLGGKKIDLRLPNDKAYAEQKWGVNPSYWYNFALPNDQGSEVYGGQTNEKDNMKAIWVYSPDAIKSIYAKYTLFRQALYATFDFKPSDLENMELRKLISQISQILGDNTELIVNR